MTMVAAASVVIIALEPEATFSGIALLASAAGF
jgi:hypothetical protein